MQTVNATRFEIRNLASKKSIALIVYILSYVFLILMLSHSVHFDSIVRLWIQLITYCVLGISGIVLFQDLFLEGIRLWKLHPLKNGIWFCAAFIGDIVLSNLAMIPLALFYPDYSSINQNSIDTVSQLAPGVMILISLGILGPVTEEAIFRFVLVEKAKTKCPTVLCIIISSILFMLIHVHKLSFPDILSNLPMLFSAVLFSVCMLKTNNPTLPVLLHVLNNAPVFLQLLFQHK